MALIQSVPVRQRIVVNERQSILPQMGVQQPPIPRTSWILLGVTLAVCTTLFVFTYGGILPSWLRWTLTGAWILLTVAMGLYDFAFHAPGSGKGTDSAPFDRWTISHGGAGLVFGAWYLPLWVTALVTIGWEVFEASVVGFGDKEILWNRAVDVGIALVGWLIVVAIAMIAVPGSPFPLLISAGH